MNDGNWIPLSKWAAKHLPKDRPYSKLEALVSIQIDYDNGNSATISGYAALWQWSRKKVRLFFDAIDVEITYPENTKKKQNQKGQIRVQIRDRSEEKKEQMKFINNKKLHNQKNRPPEKKEQIRDRSGNTTIKTKRLNTNSCTLESKKESNLKDYPYNKILDLYHFLLAELPRVRKFTEERKKMLKARWNEKAKSERGLYSNTLEFWEAFFKYISQSDFLMGRKTDFRANFEWIITKKNFNKIIEGTYHRG